MPRPSVGSGSITRPKTAARPSRLRRLGPSGNDPFCNPIPRVKLQPLFLLFHSFPLFDRAAGFPSPRPQDAEAGARRACQGWPLFSGHPQGSALTRPSTTARWFDRGLTSLRLIHCPVGGLRPRYERRCGRSRTERLRPSVRSGPIARQRRRATEPPAASRPIRVSVPTAELAARDAAHHCRRSGCQVVQSCLHASEDRSRGTVSD